ncbi:MAG: hypothetical protein IT320_11685 [Anaerolineae bacterium]|nr:hypothetical protein [Anaerolineae bacterium]
MIFGHAPIILPALTGLQLRFTPLFYGQLAPLHFALAYRMYGNLVGDLTARQRGSLLNAIAKLLFMAVTALTVIRADIERKTTVHPPTKFISQGCDQGH